MPGGRKQVVINGLERLVSVDHNRLQLFAAADLNEQLRYAMDDILSPDDLSAGTPNAAVATLTSPLTGEVLGGLLVRPQLGSLNLIVDPGVAMVVAPDGDPDSSNYKYVRDPGIQTLGALTMAANGAGSARIDVVECQYVQNANAETDNRDIFNPATGAFAATTVPKATQGTLAYRVRQGTAGSGYPGPAAGWLPLAVASVPALGGSTVDSMTFWDVRPLVADRWYQPHNLGGLTTRYRANDIYIDTVSGTPGSALLNGYVEALGADFVNFLAGTRRLGGLLGASGAINLAAQVNQDPTLASGQAYVYLVEPFGLPRWAQYSTIFGSLLPVSPRGIVVLSNVAPSSHGSPSAAVSMPTVLGLGGSATQGAVIAATTWTGTACTSTVSDGRVQFNASFGGTIACAISSPNITHSLAAGAASNSGANRLGYPSSARMVRVSYTIVLQANATSDASVFILADIQHSGTNVGLFYQGTQSMINGGGAAVWTVSFQADIPISFYQSPGNTVAVQITLGLTNCTLTSASATLIGWALGAR